MQVGEILKNFCLWAPAPQVDDFDAVAAVAAAESASEGYKGGIW